MDTISEQVQEHTLPTGRTGIHNRLRQANTWLEERTGLTSSLNRFLNYPVPLYVHKNLMYSLGGLTLISIALQFGTGILLGFYYAPSPIEN